MFQEDLFLFIVKLIETVLLPGNFALLVQLVHYLNNVNLSYLAKIFDPNHLFWLPVSELTINVGHVVSLVVF